MGLATRVLYSTEWVKDSKGDRKKEERYTIITLAICQQDKIKKDDSSMNKYDLVDEKFIKLFEKYSSSKYNKNNLELEPIEADSMDDNNSKKERIHISSLVNQQIDEYFQIDEALNYLISNKIKNESLVLTKELQFNIDVLIPNFSNEDEDKDQDQESFIQYHRTFKYPHFYKNNDGFDIDENSLNPHLKLTGMPIEDWLNWLYKLFIVGCFDLNYEFEVSQINNQDKSIKLTVKRHIDGYDKTLFKIELNRLIEVDEEAIDQVADLQELYTKSLEQSKLIDILSSEIKILLKHQINFEKDVKLLNLINENLQKNQENVLIPMINNDRKRLKDLMNEKNLVNNNKIDFSSFKKNVVYAKSAGNNYHHDNEYEIPGSSHEVISDTSLIGSVNSTPHVKKVLKLDNAKIKLESVQSDMDMDMGMSINSEDSSPTKKKSKQLPRDSKRGRGRPRGSTRSKNSTSTRGVKRRKVTINSDSNSGSNSDSELRVNIEHEGDTSSDEIEEPKIQTSRKTIGKRKFNEFKNYKFESPNILSNNESNNRKNNEIEAEYASEIGAIKKKKPLNIESKINDDNANSKNHLTKSRRYGRQRVKTKDLISTSSENDPETSIDKLDKNGSNKLSGTETETETEADTDTDTDTDD